MSTIHVGIQEPLVVQKEWRPAREQHASTAVRMPAHCVPWCQ
ncbi:hypothetical protein [Dictyobacter kobayashii]|nr:hypothetical protein [Dictyobacter kobayashii]